MRFYEYCLYYLYKIICMYDLFCTTFQEKIHVFFFVALLWAPKRLCDLVKHQLSGTPDEITTKVMRNFSSLAT